MEAPSSAKSGYSRFMKPSRSLVNLRANRQDPGPSISAIHEIEQELGDVGRGADFPMSRSRGNSMASRFRAASGPPPPSRPPPPVPPIPAHFAQQEQQSVGATGGKNNMIQSKDHGQELAPERRARARGSTAPASTAAASTASGSTAAGDPHPAQTEWPPLTHIPEKYLTMPLPPLPEKKKKKNKNKKPATSPPAQRPLPPWEQPARSVQSAYSTAGTLRSVPATPTPSRAEQHSASSLSASGSSSPSSSSATIRPEDFQKDFQKDLDPTNPYGYPAAPQFLHNWSSPNRRAAAQSIVDTSRAHRAGPNGPPVGSRPKPYRPPGIVADAVPQTTTTNTTTTVPFARPETASSGNGVGYDYGCGYGARADAGVGLYADPGTGSTGWENHPRRAEFRYYAVMSAFEAEVALRENRRSVAPSSSASSAATHTPTPASASAAAPAHPPHEARQHDNNNSNNNTAGQTRAQALPLFEQELLMSVEEAAASLDRFETALRERNLLETTVAGGVGERDGISSDDGEGKAVNEDVVISPSSSFYGDEEQVRG